MPDQEPFRIVIIKPSKYDHHGWVERFHRGFMPNSTLLHLKSMTPASLGQRPVEVEVYDEYIETDLSYIKRLQPESCSLLALAGVQSHQMHRALDLAALARSCGVQNTVIGGPHPMTCDTSEVHGRGVSFAVAEAELVWPTILQDALTGELRPVYGETQRWQRTLDPPVLHPPTRRHLGSYIIPMMGIYPARGCPYRCNFCSVVKIAGRQIRSQPVDTTVRTLLAAREAGVRLAMFTSDNFNKYKDARPLLEALIEEKINLPFFVQCDVQLSRDEAFIDLLVRAGCAQVFVGAESFSRDDLKTVHKFQNHPSKYRDLVRLCHERGVSVHFSNIIGFPGQNRKAILHHLEELRAIGPFMASFYILTPIPGTEQYDEFLSEGLICEPNLDRFDATCAVWRHPHLSADELDRLLSRCYSKFYSSVDVLRKIFGHSWNAPGLVHALGLGYAAFARFSAYRGRHPMAGGFWAVRRDRLRDYLPLRRQVFGIDQLDLPTSLSLPSATDEQLFLHKGALTAN